MFYQPEAIIYLWILPIFGMIILPVLWSITRRLYRNHERSRMSDVRGFLDVTQSSLHDKLAQDRRNYARVNIHGPKAKVAQQIKCCQTLVTNVSSHGICLQNIPEKVFDKSGGNLKVEIRTKEQIFSMFVRPKWRRLEENGYMIGAEIIKIPGGWKNFIHNICKTVAAEPT